MTTIVDVTELEAKVKLMYQAVADRPDDAYHFEVGRPLAERLGYPASMLDQIAGGSVESFAGVGYFHDLADLHVGEAVLDLGSGSGMDAFAAALAVGAAGQVIGLDMTQAQLAKARRLQVGGGIEQVEFVEGHIDDLPFANGMFDAVISNGVINLAPDKAAVFAETARVLRPGGRLAIADIVTQVQLTDAITCNVDLWASCIGGAAQIDDYRAAIEAAGLAVEVVRTNPYEFLSDQARGASTSYGVSSVSILARKPAS